MRVLAALTAVAAAGAACGGGGGGGQGELHVLAAASLTEAFTELAGTFDEREGVDVTLSFGSSAALAEQVLQGADADVYAAADERTMARVVDAGEVDDPVPIARNRLTIVVEDGNPLGIDGLDDLTRPGVVLVLCAPEAPCGHLARLALAEAGVRAGAASLEENVKGVVAKVHLGEADAGIAYATDVEAAGGRVDAVEISGAEEPALEARYAVAVLRDSDAGSAAGEWVDLVTSSEGRAVLRRHGFGGP